MSDQRFYSNGKLLLSGEYLILNGAIGLAVPTSFGQDLRISHSNDRSIIWNSYDQNNEIWLWAKYNLENLNLIESKKDEAAAQKLENILKEVRKLNPDFLVESKGVVVTTKIDFDKSWGLGTSSTLINNLAQWACVDPFLLLQNTFGGSGYDIACAQNDRPILYQLVNSKPNVQPVRFNPDFAENLFFIYLNKKQNSREGIREYRENPRVDSASIKAISSIADSLLQSRTLDQFNSLLLQHEEIISSVLNRPTVQQELFKDYKGQIKSLGAWGGDFILASGDASSPDYFRSKGFATVIPFKEMIK